MEKKERYRSYAKYLKEKYGSKTYRIGVDAGFSCPHRGNLRSKAGCTFCDVEGSRSPYLGSLEDLGEQIRQGIHFLQSRYGASQFILYFQAYTNTYAPVEQLYKIYSFGLSLGTFQELILSTRPDCLDEEKVAMIATFRAQLQDVWVELGLQSAQEETLKRIQRGHSVADFERAFLLLRSKGIKIGVHLIFGLPGEGWKEIEATLRYVASLRPDGVKIHNLHIPYTAPLFREFLQGELSLPCYQRHLDYVIKALELLPVDTLILRVTCDTPKDRLAFPRKFPDKARFLSLLHHRMEELNTWQGRLFTFSSKYSFL
ncbi:MAG: TIGR01212 family radical SAM protein [Spirochaetales bacterium]